MVGKHRRRDPANRGKGRQNSEAARYWLHYEDEDGHDCHEQCFTATELETRLGQLRGRGIRVEVENR